MSRFSDPLEGVGQGFHAPPSVTVRDASVAEELLRRHLKELSKLPIPVVGIEEPVGLDGEDFGLRVYGYFLGTQLEWWADGPRSWAAFTAAVARLRGFLAAQFA